MLNQKELNPYIINTILKLLVFTGYRIYQKGLVVAKGGNISYRINDWIIIKKTGACMGSLTLKDFKIVNINDDEVSGVSIDYKIHKEIYLNTNSSCVIHAHPPHIIKYTFISKNDTFNPGDFESRHYLGNKIPIIYRNSEVVFHIKIGKLARKTKLIIDAFHGVYIHGNDVLDMIYLLELLDHAAKLILDKENLI